MPKSVMNWKQPEPGPAAPAFLGNPGGFVSADTPVLDTLTDMTAASVEHNSLSPRDLVLARVAALIAVDAPPVSWFANASAIEESGQAAEDVQGIMIAVAPVVGGPRVAAAGGAHPAGARLRHRRE